MIQRMQNSKNIAKFVNTHGIKGEIRLLSDFNLEEIINISDKLVIDNKEFIINSTRPHKNFTLVTLEGVNSINDIEYLKGNDVFFDIEEINVELPLQYIGFNVYEENKKVGIIKDYFKQGKSFSLVVELNDGSLSNIPMVEEIIDITDDKIKIKQKGLFENV
jgi:16S rRNA processing protein RimM